MLFLPNAILAMPDGEERRFMERLYGKYYLLMYNVARRYTRQIFVADDIVSDSCVRLIRNISTLRTLDGGELQSYIVAAVRDAAIDDYRRRSRVQEMELPPIGELPDASDARQDMDQRLAWRDELRRVLRALKRLPEKEQQVMRMKFSYDMTDREIAERTGLSVNSIPKYVSRARKRLRAMLYSEEEGRA